MFGNRDVRNLENSLLSWIFDHLGEKSYMTDEVNQFSSSPKVEPPNNEGVPLIDDRPLPKREINTMTQGDLDCLRESCSFPTGIRTRLPEDDETRVYSPGRGGLQ